MKIKFRFTFLLIGLLFICSCNEDSNVATNDQTKFNQISNTVTELTAEAINHITSTVDDDKIIFDANTPQSFLPQIGTIIHASATEKMPYGFLGKVVSVEKEGNYVIKTEEVPLDEAFPNLSIDTVLNIMDNIEGVFDEDGNPVDFSIEDASLDAKTRSAAEFDWDKKTLNIPIPKDLLGDDFSAKGSMKVSFAGSKFDLDNKDALKYLNLELHPSITLNASITTKIKSNKKEFKTKPLKIKARAVVGPVIIPITIPLYFKAGIKGEVTSTLQLNYSKACNAYVRYQNERWSKGCEPIKDGDENPWYVTGFDVKGSIYAGIDVEFIAGIYTRNAGIGFELYPNASLSAEASLSSVNPFKVNPDVTLSVDMESRVFCMAKLFNRKLEVFDLKLPDFTFYKRTLSLFPSIENFTAQGGSASGELDWQNDSYYFLQGLGVKTGAIVYQPDKTTEFNSYYPAHTSIDKKGIRYYKVNVTGLKSGETYYASPAISWLNFNWYGEKEEFTTEASYNLGFRCVNQGYDVISFNFSLNNTSGNTIDYTTEAQDYDGSPMRVHITAQYNSSTKTLDGIFDFYFYDDPSQQRKDGFSVSLATDDSGYVDCSKVVDNGGCYAALRIYKSTNAAASKKRYARALVDDDCNIGIYNKNYQK